MYFVKYGNEYLHDPRIDGRRLLDLTLDGEENSCGFCDFTIYPDHPMYDKIKEHDAENPIEVYDDGILLFAGFIYELGKEFYLDGHVKCKGELDYLNESIIRPYSTEQKGYGLKAPETVNGLFQFYIDQHNSQAAPNKRFTIGINQGGVLVNDNLIFSESIEYPTVLEEIKEKLLDNFGGYIRIRHEDGVRYIDYLKEWTDTNSQILDFGVNLTDYTQTDDSADVATFVVPLGAKMSETNYEYDDGYHITEDSVVYASKEYYTESGDGYTRCEDLASFASGVTYYESNDNGYYATSDTSVDSDKTYYLRNEIIDGYSKCSDDLTAFKTGVTYYEYFEEQDESDLPLTIDSLIDRRTSQPGFIKAADYIYSEDAIAQYGWIGKPYKNTDILDKEDLLSAGIIALKEMVSPKRTIEIKAVDMHLVNPSIKPIRIGEYVRVRSKPHKLDSYFLCVSIDLDLNNPENSLYTLGTTFDTLTGQQNKKINQLNATINKQYERVEESLVNQAFEKAEDAARLAGTAYTQAYDATTAAINAKNAADANTASITLLESNVSTVSGTATAASEQAAQAIADALAASAAAGTASAIANQINTEIEDVQGDAETLRDAIEGQIETKVTTMTADYVRTTDLTSTETTLRSEITQSAAALSTSVEQTYAKITDLTAVETDLRSELRQTSSSIESVVSDVTTIQVDVTTAQESADEAYILAASAETSAESAGLNSVAAQNAANAAQAAATQAQSDIDSLQSTVTTRFSEIEQTSSSITSTVSEVQTKVNNIQIGGRNLIADTNVPTVLTASASNYNYKAFAILEDAFEVGVDYTFSANVSVDSGTATEISIRVMNSDHTQVAGHFKATIENGRIRRTFKITSTAYQFCKVIVYAGVYAETANIGVTFSNIKLEKGNQKTDWTIAPEDTESRISTIEQTVDGVSVTLSDLKIGCRNLLIGTAAPFTHTGTGSTNECSNMYDLSDYYVHLPSLNGEKLTLSFEWTSTATSGTFYVQLNNTPHSRLSLVTTVSSTNQSGRSVYTLTCDAGIDTGNYWGVKVRSDNLTGTITIKNVMLEVGTKNSSWQPAPEDISSNVSDAAKTATNYLNFSSGGLVVGDMTANELGKNVQIDNSSVNIRNGSTVVASFGASEIDFENPVVFTADGILLNNGDAYAHLARNNILWSHSNGYYMNADQSAQLSTNISRQISGVVLAWCQFNPDTGLTVDSNWRYFFVPKTHVVNHGGDGVMMSDPYLGFMKYVYISNSSISGHANNSTSGTTNGIAWNNRYYTLRYVIGV